MDKMITRQLGETSNGVFCPQRCPTCLIVPVRDRLGALSVGSHPHKGKNIACYPLIQPTVQPFVRNTQGCNSRVFRATLRPRRQDQHTCSLNGSSAKIKHYQDAHPASMASPSVAAAASGPSAESGHSSGTSSSMAPRGGSIVDGLVDIGERFWTGSFGACFTGSHASVQQGGTEAREASRLGKAGDGRADTEWAIKMALTLVGQDPLQVFHPHLGVPPGFWLDLQVNLFIVFVVGLGVETALEVTHSVLLLWRPGFKCRYRQVVDSQMPNTRTAVQCQETLPYLLSILHPTRRLRYFTRRRATWKLRLPYSSVGASLPTLTSCAAFIASR